MWVGAAAWPTLIQAQRATGPANLDVRIPPQPMKTQFEGLLTATGPGSDGLSGWLEGDLEIDVKSDRLGPEVVGRFRGVYDGRSIDRELVPVSLKMDRTIGAGARRGVEFHLMRRSDEHPQLDLRLSGSIARPLYDSFQTPPSSDELRELHGRLGKKYELALMFTAVAGLLNILAIWDAVAGPAYGWGDEPPEEKPSNKNTPPAPGVKT
jgi:hypothetical protein